MYRLVPTLVARWARPIRSWPRQALITETLKLEETRFRKTLDRGLSLLDEAERRSCREGDRSPAKRRSSSMTPMASRST
jgi:alanyl-tRNA synthetase